MPSSPLALALLAALAVSAIALVGIVFVVWQKAMQQGELGMIGFAAGVLLAAAFLELLPSAIARSAPAEGNVFVWALGAMVAFFFLERFLHGFHEHDAGHEGHGHHDHALASRTLILIGDGLHNFVDGVVIAASFLAGPSLGLATTLAVAAHEVPQEIADYAILVRGRLSPQRALFLNFLSGLSSVLGVLACFAFRDVVERHLASCLTATAGMFIYIAASDLIPELHHPRHRGRWLPALPLLAGVTLIALLSRFVSEPG